MSSDAVRAVIDNSPELQNKPLSDDDEIRRLAKVPSLQYERERKAAAEKLRIGVGALDALIKKARNEGSGTIGQGRQVELEEVQPWPEQVDGAVLLADVSKTLRNYVVVSDAQVDAMTLWCGHTHAHEAADVSPKLVLRSVQKRSPPTRAWRGRAGWCLLSCRLRNGQTIEGEPSSAVHRSLLKLTRQSR